MITHAELVVCYAMRLFSCLGVMASARAASAAETQRTPASGAFGGIALPADSLFAAGASCIPGAIVPVEGHG